MLYKIRTSVSLNEHTFKWAKENIRNLSAFIDARLMEEMKARGESPAVYIQCICGIQLSTAGWEKSSWKCPECHREMKKPEGID